MNTKQQLTDDISTNTGYKDNIFGFNISSLKKLDLISRPDYCSKLRKYLPEECFKPDKRHLVSYFVALATYIFCMNLIVSFSFLPLKLVFSFVMGIALASLTFFLHDVMHGSIVRSKLGSYFLGLSVGMLNLFPPLFWKKVHNLHHSRTGNFDDPDRSYIYFEKPKNIFEKVGYRTRVSSDAYHPLISLIMMSTGFFWYFGNTLLVGLILSNKTIFQIDKVNRVKELFNIKDKLIIAFELVFIFTIQAFLFNVIADKNLLTYFLISIIPVGIAHFIAMSYIHTNHFLSPLTGDIDDPLVNSLSIKNSKFVDKIFLNFSHHVEHHLFPTMGSSHYPKVRKLLLEFYPERYKLMPIKDAFSFLFSSSRIYSDYSNLLSFDGKKKTNCLLPN